jgi:tRNA (mo5U34)-methyltransferase
MPAGSIADLRSRVDQLTWFHRIDLGNGIVTPGMDKSARKLRALRLPPLSGKSVLDLGANDGYFSFAAEKAGASRVLAVDSFCWNGTAPGGQTRATFDLAREALDSNVEALEADLFDLAPEAVGTFDVVLMLGVLYHLRDPLLGLAHAAALTRETLVVETLVDLVWTQRPAAAFYPGDDVRIGDDTNWWGPNPPAVVGMLRACGFDDVEVIGPRDLLGKLVHTGYNAANIARSRISKRHAPLRWSYLTTDRAIFHARRRPSATA